jgi:phosphohistidine phosphatase
MKYLTLIRHAKSDWDNDFSDHYRPLSKRGLKDAPIIGQYLFNNISKPNLLISSTAERAKQTAMIISKEIHYPVNQIIFYDTLYLCGISDYIGVLQKQADTLNHIYLVSHNPGTTGFANILCNAGINNVPTCGVVHIELGIASWLHLEPYKGTLLSFITPKSIK